MSHFDEMESWKLEARISEIENKLSNSGASVGSSTSMLSEILNEAKKQLNGLEMKGQSHSEEERKKANAELAAVVHLVAQETALSQRERQQYGAFIQKEFFTKSDFTALEDFYASAWERLTETGKSQMSQRVWEGVRQEQYQFSELPENVKEKEAKRLFEALRYDVSQSRELNRIPAGDYQEFIKAWDDGREEEAFEVLNRPSFAENVALSQKVQGNAVTDLENEVGSNASELEARNVSDSIRAPLAELKKSDGLKL